MRTKPEYLFCFDCDARFDTPLMIGEAGGKPKPYCPECKGPHVRMKFPEFDPDGLRIRIDVEQVDNRYQGDE